MVIDLFTHPQQLDLAQHQIQPIPANQYYKWMIGLGLSYNIDSFGCQFCIPRNTANPVLSVRYKESNPTATWGGWTGITATGLNGLAVLTADNWLRSSDSTRQRLFFTTNGTTYYQGFNVNGTYNHEFSNAGGGTTMGLKENGEIYLTNDVWHRSIDSAYRFYFAGGGGTTYLAGGNTDSGGICTTFMSGTVSGFANLMSHYNNGNIT